MKQNPLLKLREYGQSVWMDFVSRKTLDSGQMARWIGEDGVAGVTSNPAIFEKAIAGGDEYDDSIRSLAMEGLGARQIYDALTVEDIQRTADLLRPLYDRTNGGDGYVSLEVSPHLANDTAGTIGEVHRLWDALARPNVMIKIPATREGLPAIRQTIADGLNINITLLFGLPRYREVAEAYIGGLEDRLAQGEPINGIASVASFFLSRIDVLLDPKLEAIAKEGGDRSRMAQAMQGQAAIASAKIAYEMYKRIFGQERFRRLEARGARRQRLLWASTSTKNPSYTDVKYVEPLIGENTINTMPPETLDAYRDHGKPAPRLEEGLGEAYQVLDRLKDLGIDLDAATQQLEDEGIQKFNAPFDSLARTLEEKRREAQQAPVDRQDFALGPASEAVSRRLEEMRQAQFGARLWRKDASLWDGDPQNFGAIHSSLGWLDVAEQMMSRLNELREFAAQVRAAGYRYVVHMGMGGSSLAPLTFQRTFGPGPDGLPLAVLDSTSPSALLAIEHQVDLETTLFIEASKSGATAESRAFGEYFYEKVGRIKGDQAGENFVVITDPGTPLAKLAEERHFRRAFLNFPDIGGRYSALSYFGLVPASLMGLDVARLLRRAILMTRACGPSVPVEQNPGLVLGAVLGELARGGRDKVTFLMPQPIRTMGMWLEQLLAESTGKSGTGLLPVAGESAGEPPDYGDDRVFVHFHLGERIDDRLENAVAALQSAGHPVVTIHMGDLMDIGQEFVRWEVATATAGAILGITPFDQPNVQESKDNTDAILQEVRREGHLPEHAPALAEYSLRYYGQEGGTTGAETLRQFFGQVHPGDYLALMAYLPEEPETEQEIERMRTRLRDSLRVATTLGYGPRFLHSTGQYHKGGPNTGLFLQLTASPAQDAAVPGQPYTFGVFQQAQAMGDFESLRRHGRRILRVDLGADVRQGLSDLREAIEQALSGGRPRLAA